MAEILYKNISVFGQPHQRINAFIAFKILGYGLFVAVVIQESHREIPPTRRHGPGQITALWVLHLYDTRPLIAQ
jgi:hypothetical protein